MTAVICFDLWQTLATEPYSLEDYWAPLLQRYPANIERKQLLTLVDQIPMKKNQPLSKSVAQILSVVGIHDIDVEQAVIRRWKTSVRRARLFADTLPTLRRLRARGYRLALITNTSREGWEALNAKTDIGSFFDACLCSFELGSAKPEPAIFMAVEKLFESPWSSFMMVGDSVQSDIVPARTRGWSAARIDRTGATQDDTISDLIKLESRLSFCSSRHTRPF